MAVWELSGAQWAAQMYQPSFRVADPDPHGTTVVLYVVYSKFPSNWMTKLSPKLSRDVCIESWPTSCDFNLFRSSSVWFLIIACGAQKITFTQSQ
jgi:hypothetical protein